MQTTPNDIATEPVFVQLDGSLDIKAVEDVRTQFLGALDRASSLVVDLTRLVSMDTAGVQLLLALRGEAVKRSVPLQYRGESAVFIQALAVLGLHGNFQSVASHA